MNKKLQLEKLNSRSINTLMETLGIKYTDIGEDYLVATMPVTSKVYQPTGILHGGATVALAESVGSMAAHYFVDNHHHEVRGLEITANHLRSVRKGFVTATAKPIHTGKTTHLWEIRVVDQHDKLVSLCKLTIIVLTKG